MWLSELFGFYNSDKGLQINVYPMPATAERVAQRSSTHHVLCHTVYRHSLHESLRAYGGYDICIFHWGDVLCNQ